MCSGTQHAPALGHGTVRYAQQSWSPRVLATQPGVHMEDMQAGRERRLHFDFETLDGTLYLAS